MKKSIINKAETLIKKNVLSIANVMSPDGKSVSEMKNVITSDSLVDILYELYPNADELTDDYDKLRQMALDKGLTIISGEDITV